MEETQPEISSPIKTENNFFAKNKKKLLITGLAGLILLIAGISAGIFVHSTHKQALEEQAKKPLPELYFSITPPFIVNFQTLGRIRYMQIGVDVMTRDQEVLDAVKDNLPLIKNNLLALFDAQDFDVMATAQGRQALRQAALTEVQKVIQAKMGRPGVEAVLFTSFIIQ
jgi:flagellar FliL protein